MAAVFDASVQALEAAASECCSAVAADIDAAHAAELSLASASDPASAPTFAPLKTFMEKCHETKAALVNTSGVSDTEAQDEVGSAVNIALRRYVDTQDDQSFESGL